MPTNWFNVRFEPISSKWEFTKDTAAQNIGWFPIAGWGDSLIEFSSAPAVAGEVATADGVGGIYWTTPISGGDQVKISGTDTTASYLQDKLKDGDGIQLIKVNPGGNEHLTVNQIIKTGAGNPNGSVIGFLGDTYMDLVTNIFYRCVSGATSIWNVV